METAIDLKTYLAWDDSCQRTAPSESDAHRSHSTMAAFRSVVSKVPETLTNLVFAPENLNDLYTTFYVHDGILSKDSTPPIAAASPADQLALVRDSFGFSITRIAEIFGKSRPTIYQWMKEGKTDPKALAKLATLASAGEYWKTITGGSDRTWLLEQPGADSPSIMDVLRSAVPDPGNIRKLMDLRLAEYEAASTRTREILGKNGISKTMSNPNTLTEAQQMRDRTWTGIRENLSETTR